MSLSPGTRIPTVYQFTPCELGWICTRWMMEGITIGLIAGSLVTACCLALAWSHWG